MIFDLFVGLLHFASEKGKKAESHLVEHDAKAPPVNLGTIHAGNALWTCIGMNRVRQVAWTLETEHIVEARHVGELLLFEHSLFFCLEHLGGKVVASTCGLRAVEGPHLALCG